MSPPDHGYLAHQAKNLQKSAEDRKNKPPAKRGRRRG